RGLVPAHRFEEARTARRLALLAGGFSGLVAFPRALCRHLTPRVQLPPRTSPRSRSPPAAEDNAGSTPDANHARMCRFRGSSAHLIRTSESKHAHNSMIPLIYLNSPWASLLAANGARPSGSPR